MSPRDLITAAFGSGGQYEDWLTYAGEGFENVTISDRATWFRFSDEPDTDGDPRPALGPYDPLWLDAMEAGDKPKPDYARLVELLRSRVTISPLMARMLADFVERREIKKGDLKGLPWKSARVELGDKDQLVVRVRKAKAPSRALRNLIAGLLSRGLLGRPRSRRATPAYERSSLDLAVEEALVLIDQEGCTKEEAARRVAYNYSIPHLLATGDDLIDYSPLMRALKKSHAGRRRILKRRSEAEG